MSVSSCLCCRHVLSLFSLESFSIRLLIRPLLLESLTCRISVATTSSSYLFFLHNHAHPQSQAKFLRNIHIWDLVVANLARNQFSTTSIRLSLMQAVWSTYSKEEKQVLAQSSNPSSREYSATIYQAGECLHTRQFSSLNNGEKQAAIDGIRSCVKDQNLLKGYEGLLRKCSPYTSLAHANACLANERLKVISDCWSILKANPTYMLLSLGHAMVILLSCVCQWHQLQLLVDAGLLCDVLLLNSCKEDGCKEFQSSISFTTRLWIAVKTKRLFKYKIATLCIQSFSSR